MKIKIASFGEGAANAEYHPYDSAMPELFQSVKQLITDAMPNAQVEHVGSSSIPGVGGRNVLDIAIPANEEDHETIRKQLLQLGFENSPFPHYLALMVASVKTEEKKYFVLLYIISPQHDTYKDWISFRNYMCTHPGDANAYGEIKKQAVAQGNTRGDNYQDAKAPFLQQMAEKIKLHKQ